LNVFYDRKNDVVSIYFNAEDQDKSVEADNIRDEIKGRNYEVDEAANLILDMIDLLDDNGKLMGFRVFNASKHYDLQLLEAADVEELSQEELSKRQNERVIGVFDKA
jgi:uncharacterized protein YuzE